MFETENIRMFNEQVRQVTQILRQSLSQLSVAFALMPRAKLLGFFSENLEMKMVLRDAVKILLVQMLW